MKSVLRTNLGSMDGDEQNDKMELIFPKVNSILHMLKLPS